MAKKKTLNEDFLDGEEEKNVTAQTVTNSAPSEEVAPETVEPEQEEEDFDNFDTNTDVSEEPSATEENEEDDIDFGEDNDNEEEVQDVEPAPSQEDTNSLKDQIANLTTLVQQLTNKIDTLEKPKEEAPAEGGEEAPAEGSNEGSEEGGEEGEGDFDFGDDEGSEEGGEEAPAEGGESSSNEAPAEGSSEGEAKPEEGDKSDDDFAGDEGSEEKKPEEGEQKSEAFKPYFKAGSYLSEKSDYLIGKLYNGRFDKLEAPIMSLVESRIRQLINKEKAKLRMEAVKNKLSK